MAGGLSEGVRRAARELTTRMVDDARGRRVRLYDLNAWPWDHLRGDDSISKHTYDAIIESLSEKIRPRDRVLMVGVLVVLASLVWYWLLKALRASPTMNVLGVVVFGAALLGIIVMIGAMVRRTHYGVRLATAEPEKIASAIAAHGHCASCGQNLRGLPIADDGCIVCPECGAAWATGQRARDALLVGGGIPVSPQGERVERLSSLTPRIKDARGTEVRMIDLANPKQLFPWWADLPWATQRRVVRHVKRSAVSFVVTAIPGAILLLGLYFTIRSAWRLSQASAAAWFPSLLSAVVVMPLGVLILICYNLWRGYIGFNQPREIVAAFLLERLCPTCGQSLESLPVAADGCTVCPECGSAWKLESTPSEARA